MRSQWRCDHYAPAGTSRVSAVPTQRNLLEKPRESTRSQAIRAGSRLPQTFAQVRHSRGGASIPPARPSAFYFSPGTEVMFLVARSAPSLRVTLSAGLHRTPIHPSAIELLVNRSRFAGRINWVQIDLGDADHDPSSPRKRIHAAMTRQRSLGS